ncbi:MAG TPA: cytochrome c oxidase assembly protein [Acidimicrobiales bacterium]|nr:cytochrome c oxidase assembly protein [Acidimicrobiales bacterium]
MPEVLGPVVAVTAAAWTYAVGMGRRSAAGRPAPAAEVTVYGTGLLTLLVVLLPPFEELAERRLWAHMVQHVTIVAVAAPLLVLGNTSGVLTAGLPRSWRARGPVAVQPSRFEDPARATVLAAVALVGHTGALWAWHLPSLYEPALRSAPVHALEHASLFVTALFFWLVVAGSRRRAGSGAAVLVTFVAALQGSALGALMTLAGSSWYPTYAKAATGGGLTPLEDQQVAGVVMWGPCGAIYTLAGVLLLAAWIRRSEREGRPAVSSVGWERSR